MSEKMQDCLIGFAACVVIAVVDRVGLSEGAMIAIYSVLGALGVMGPVRGAARVFGVTSTPPSEVAELKAQALPARKEITE